MADDFPFGVDSDPLNLGPGYELVDVQRNRPSKNKRLLGRSGNFLTEKYYDPQTKMTLKYAIRDSTQAHGITAHGQAVNGWTIDDWSDPKKNEDHNDLTVECHKNVVA